MLEDIISRMEAAQSHSKIEWSQIQSLIISEIEKLKLCKKELQRKNNNLTSKVKRLNEKAEYWKSRAERLEC